MTDTRQDSLSVCSFPYAQWRSKKQEKKMPQFLVSVGTDEGTN